jgi:hypothetical protein
MLLIKEIGMRKYLLLLVVFVFVLCPVLVDAAPKADTKYIVYYFRTTGRCHSCIQMEKMTKETVENDFAKEVKNGLIEFRSVDVEIPQNKHYIKDYGLYTKSVIISEVKNGKEVRWKNLDQIWKKLRNEYEFRLYITQETQKFMKGAK